MFVFERVFLQKKKEQNFLKIFIKNFDLKKNKTKPKNEFKCQKYEKKNKITNHNNTFFLFFDHTKQNVFQMFENCNLI